MRFMLLNYKSSVIMAALLQSRVLDPHGFSKSGDGRKWD